MKENINKYTRKFAGSIRINDVIKYNGDHYDVSDVQNVDDQFVRIRMLSFTKNSIVDGNFQKDHIFDVLKTRSIGIF